MLNEIAEEKGPSNSTPEIQVKAEKALKAHIISDEEFRKLSLCQKFKHVSALLCTACRNNKMFLLLFIASSVTRLYYVMFSTFWVLYLTSYVGVDNIFKDD